jgi:LuxR family maltose regulon positive regulatory protein
VETILLQTKLFIPSLRSSLVPRPQLIAKLNRERSYKLILVSAPAGYGKTTLLTEWIDQIRADVAVCWLSLDEDDSDRQQFFNYLAAAIRPLPDSQSSLLQLLQSPQTLPAKNLMAAFVNDVTPVSTSFLLVLDDYHAIELAEIDQAVAFLLDNMPPQMTLAITSRADPGFPISRLRARDKLIELRADDLRFTEAEAALFLRQSMNLTLSSAQVAALENRTEGWIAGLQMAALSMQKRDDVTGFIDSFTGSHRFIMDYLLEEVLNQQPAEVQAFLLQTAVLTRLNADLCHAVVGIGADASQQILEELYRHNIFLTPLDDERRWYRYHHLFADLLRQRLQQNMAECEVAELHCQASQWYEANSLELEAFHHAVAANDVERALRLIEGEGLPLYFRGEAIPVRHWLESLPEAEFKARPSLWVTYASVLTMTGRLHGNIEEILQAAETAVQDAVPDDKTNDLLGQIAAIRAMLAVTKSQVNTIVTQSRRALELLHPDNASMRTTTTWTLGYAYQVQGDRAAAGQAYAETIAHSQKSGNIMTEIAATTCLGQIQETENKTHQAAKTFQRILQLVGDPPWPAACEACVGLARIHYQWNDLETAEQFGQQGLALARQLENVDTPAACGVLLARVKLAQGDTAGARARLAEAEQFVRQHHFDHWVGEITAVRIQMFLHQGNLTAAAQLAETHDLPLGEARVKLAQGDPTAALAALEPARQQAEANDWADERLQAMVLQALAYDAAGESEKAVQLLGAALALAESGGLIRLFVDKGPAMAALLREAVKQGVAPDFVQQLLAALGEMAVTQPQTTQPLPDPLSDRELEVLKLLTTSLSGPEIARELMVSLNTMRTHTKNIYSKLGVNSRRTAVRRAEELNLL